MANNNETTTKFKVDISELKSAMQEAKKQVALANSEFKAVSSSMDNWRDSADGISAKLNQLKSNLSSQQSVLREYERVLEQVKEEYGENSNEAREWQTKLNNQQAVVNSTEREIRNLEDSLDDVGKSAKESSDGFTVMKGAMANLVADGINLAISGLKELGSAMVNMVKESVSSYAEYEQLIGGVETLFKDSSDAVLAYANNAYKTAGLSANEYMETVTSFSASLLQSLKGDTVKASKVADQAITDMSDNANKMGTSIELIQNAYNGFAKGNFTMLDNLKLGYGGTKEEMQRLLKEAQKISKVKYNIDNFADIANAIHVIQVQMGMSGITMEEYTKLVESGTMTQEEAFELLGATAKEASTTIEGSIGSMKSAWTNLVTGMADPNANFSQLVENLVDGVRTVITNLLPVVTQAIAGLGSLLIGLAPVLQKELPRLISEILPVLSESVMSLIEVLLASITSLLPQLAHTVVVFIPQLVDTLLGAVPELLNALERVIYHLINGLVNMIPDLLKSAVNFFNALPEALSFSAYDLMENLVVIIDNLIYGLIDAMPELLDGAMKFFSGLTEAIPDTIDSLLSMLPLIIEAIVDLIVTSVPQLVDASITLLMALVDAIPIIIPILIEQLPTIINAYINGLMETFPVLFEASVTLFMALVEAIPVIITELAKALPDVVSIIIVGLATLLDEIGVNILDPIMLKVKEFFTNLIETGKTEINNFIEGLMQFLKELPDKIAYTLGFCIGKLIQFGANAIAWVKNDVPLIIENIVNYFKQLPDKIHAWLTNVITKLTEWKDNLIERGKEAGKGLQEAVVNAVKELPDKMLNIGRDVVNGLWEGISNGWNWLKDKVSDLAGTLLQGAKDALGIHSPSKEFAKIGKFIDEGLMLGIDDNAKNVLSSVKNLTAGVMSTARDNIPSIGGTVGGGVVNNFTQVINSPKQLSRLDIYRQSKNLLSYAGGGA